MYLLLVFKKTTPIQEVIPNNFVNAVVSALETEFYGVWINQNK